MRWLITGARGFLGGSVARYAAARGDEVLAVTRGPAPRGSDSMAWAEARTAPELAAICATFAPDAVLHAAGTASVAASLADPRADFAGSVETWATLLEAVRVSGRRPAVILPSSAAVYGDPAALPVGEDAAAAPVSPYGFHKVSAELLGREYAACFGIDVTVARLFSVFGPAQRRLLVWDLYERLSRAGGAAWVEGTGAETRDFLHVDDVSRALLGLVAKRRVGPGDATIVNVASGRETSVLELAAMVKTALGSDASVERRGLERPGDPRRWQADVTRLRGLLGEWSPEPLEAAIGSCVARWRAESA